MAIDVLRFNELKRGVNDFKCVTSPFFGCQTTFNSATASLASCYSGGPLAGFVGKCGVFYGNCAQAICGANLFPALPGTPSGFSVCDTSTCFNQGVCCLWTVPGGASFIRFQLWGAGAPSSGAQCCAIAPSGGTGAYASVIIPAVAGCQYTICAGCAWWPGAPSVSSTISNIGQFSGCASFVQGFGLCNFCAEGGEASLCNYNNRMNFCNALAGSNVLTPAQALCDAGVFGLESGGRIACLGSMACLIASGNPQAWLRFPYNMANVTFGVCTCWPTMYLSSCRTYYGSVALPVASTDTICRVYGIPGLLSSMCVEFFSGSLCGSICSAGVYPFSSAGPSISFTSTSYCGGCLCGTVPCLVCNFGSAHPGMGGVGVRVSAGSIGEGMPGKMGMVCVQFV